ncbi:MAG: hypothetical protein ACRD50_15080 [Candidatus Acidiferrales bacterium]
MNNWKTTTASTGALLSALLTLGCCLPMAFLGAAGLAGASVFLAAERPWLLGVAFIFLGVGFFQVYRGARCRARQSKFAIGLLVLATLCTILLLAFPQFVALLVASLWRGGAK